MSGILPYEIYYENSNGERLTLSELPYLLTEGQLFDAKWQLSTVQRPLGEGLRLLSARHNTEERTVTVRVVARDRTELSALLQNMSNVFDSDIVSLQPGRLWINGQYMTCWCAARQKELSCDFTAAASVTVSILPETPVWCSEKHYVMLTDSDADRQSYPYAYPYRYSMGTSTMTVENTGRQECPMRIIFRGEAENPCVYVNGVQIGVNVTLSCRESAVIDQQKRSVYTIDENGEQTNCFNSRIKNGLTFTMLPVGESIVYCDSAGEVEVVVIEQRSEPEWALS